MRQVLLPQEMLRVGLSYAANEIMPGHNAALVRSGLAQIAGNLGLQLQESFDSLDAVTFAILEVAGGERAALLRHRGGPDGQTEIWLTRPSRKLLASIRADLELADQAVLWEAPGLED